MEPYWKSYVYAALFLAIAIVVQSLRLIFPMIPGPVNMFLIGSLVNAILVAAVCVTQRGWTAAIGLFLPLVAFLQGHLPAAPLIPVVGIGNALFAFLVWRLWSRRVVWLAAFFKAGFLYGGTLLVISLLGLPDKLAVLLSFMMGWPQIVTGCLGIFIARLLLLRIRTQKNI